MGPTAHCDSPPPASGQPHGRPTLARPLFSRAPGEPQYGRRGRGDEGRRVISLGLPGGAAAFGGPGGPAKPTQGRGPKAPAPALCALCAPAAPPGTLRFSAVQTIHPPPFPALPSRKPNEPAAPDERRASIIRCKPRKVFQQVFPRFFQKRAGGYGGRAAPRMKPPTGSRGRAPAGTHPPYLPTQKREKIRWITASSTVLPVMRPKASRALRRSVAKQSGSGA